MRIETTLTTELDKNVQLLQNTIQDQLLITKTFDNPLDPKKAFCLLYLSYMVDKNTIHEAIIRPILQFKEKNHDENEHQPTEEFINENLLVASEVKVSNIINEISQEVMYGKSILLLDGYDKGWIIETTNRAIRSHMEPESESVMSGPREGLTESLIFNLGLIRRKVLSPHFKVEYRVIGKETNTKMCFCYLDNMIDPNLINMVRKRIEKIHIDGVLDTNMISEKIRDKKYSPFKTVNRTERPDEVVRKLLQGKVAIILDGTPAVLTVPCLFYENFVVCDDYYINFYFASFDRMLRLFGFLISILVPALYVAIVTRHWDIIPTKLALSIANAQQGVPLPTVAEAVVLLIIFEIIRETGLRTPQSIGNALSIVGAIVIGQAAVDARLVSAPMVIIVAITAISSLINPKLRGPALVLRFTFLFMAAILGFYGVIFAIVGLIVHLLKIKSFTVDYLEHFVPFKWKNLRNTILRFPEDDINQKEI